MSSIYSVRFTQRPKYKEGIANIEKLVSDDLWYERLFSRRCMAWFEKHYQPKAVYLTSSCSQAFQLLSQLLSLEEGAEVILPSFTHPSTANAFASRGARLVFVDASATSPLMDTSLVLKALSSRTRAIVAVHYGGMAADMEALSALARDHGCLLIEDNAHGLLATRREKLLGTYGHFSCFSFEQQKNITCGEGGALLINDPSFCQKASLVYEAGTNKHAYVEKKVSAYRWQCLGNKYAPSELVSAYLCAGLEEAPHRLALRRHLWTTYHKLFHALGLPSTVGLPVPEDKGHNAHLYYLMLENGHTCKALQQTLSKAGIESHTHYQALHSSPQGINYRFVGTKACHAHRYADCLLRLPFHEGMSVADVGAVVEVIAQFFLPKLYNKPQPTKIADTTRSWHPVPHCLVDE